MPVQNVVLKAVEARRYQDPSGPMQVRIDHNSHLSLVQADGDDRLRVEFQFTTSYGALGIIKLEGHLIVSGAGKEAATQWEKTRNLPPDVAQQVHAAILQAGIPEAVGLAKQIRLPPPIPLPQVRIGQGADAKAEGQAPADAPEIG